MQVRWVTCVDTITLDVGQEKLSEEVVQHINSRVGWNLLSALTDQIALPDFYFGAMENWGLVTYRETKLLYDPSTSSNRNKETTATIIAHELAHMVNCFSILYLIDWFTNWWVNSMWCFGAVVWEPGDSALVERGLAERGIRDVCVLPGSRSRWAFVERGEMTTVHIHLDAWQQLISWLWNHLDVFLSVCPFAPERPDNTQRRPQSVCSRCPDVLSSSVLWRRQYRPSWPDHWAVWCHLLQQGTQMSVRSYDKSHKTRMVFSRAHNSTKTQQFTHKTTFKYSRSTF